MSEYILYNSTAILMTKMCHLLLTFPNYFFPFISMFCENLVLFHEMDLILFFFIIRVS